jgi:3-phytase
MVSIARSEKRNAAWFVVGVSLVVFLAACAAPDQTPAPVQTNAGNVVVPVVVTEKTAVDSDDPAIWINPDDPAKSLILGTDKGGSVFVFDLDGKIIPEKTVSGMGRMNNIDVAYDFPLGGETIDIAVASDRNEEKLRIFRLPYMTPIDNGGIPTFVGETDDRRVMGVAIFTRPSDIALLELVRC